MDQAVSNSSLGDQGEVLRRVHSSESASGLEGVAALPRWLELWHGLSGDNAPTGTNAATLARATELAETKPEDAVPEYTPILAARQAQQNFVSHDPRSKRNPALLLAAALLLAILTSYLILRGSAHVQQGGASPGAAAQDVKSGTSRPQGLALRVERQGDDLRLDWDHTAPVLIAATGGMLTIREGNGREKQVMLDGNLLRSGAMVYRPVHGDVSLRLVIFGQEGAKMGESISSYPHPIPANGSDRYKEKQ